MPALALLSVLMSSALAGQISVPLDAKHAIVLPAAFNPEAARGWEGPLWNLGAYAGLNNIAPGCKITGDPTRQWEDAFHLRFNLPHESALAAPLISRLEPDLREKLDRIHKLTPQQQNFLLARMDDHRDKAAPEVARAADELMDAEVRSLRPETENDTERLSEQLARLEAVKPFFEKLSLYGGAFAAFVWELDTKADELRGRRQDLILTGEAAKLGHGYDPTRSLASDLAHIQFHGSGFAPGSGITTMSGDIDGVPVRLAMRDREIEDFNVGGLEQLSSLEQLELKGLWVSALANFRRYPRDEAARDLLYTVAKRLNMTGDLYHVMDAVEARKSDAR